MSQPISIHLNGEVTQICQPQSLAALVNSLGVDLRQVAVEHNRSIIQRAQLDTVTLSNGDHVEIVEFIGGG